MKDSMKELKQIDVLRAGQTLGLVGALLGFIVAVLVIFFSIVGGLLAFGPFFPRSMTVVAIVTFPILYGVGAFLSAVIFSLLYNFIASKVGGIQIDLK